jgi:His/Glu/Gln/Arg/opine family amino acid ABC transporter permease subunit
MSALDFSVITNNLPFFAKGYWNTLELTAATVVGGLVFGTPLAVARASSNGWIRNAALGLIEVIRGVPILMLIFWIYFLLPRLLGTAVPAYAAGLVALVIFNAGYSAEIVRAGMTAVQHGQTEAAIASGLSRLQALRHIVLPQAFAHMKPALINQIVMVYKTTSLVFIIGVVDFFRAAMIVDNREFKSLEIYIFVGLVYMIPSTLLSRYSRYIERKRMRRIGTAHAT